MADPSPLKPPLSCDEWLTRYRKRVMDRSGLRLDAVELMYAAEDFAELSEMFEDDPEGAADEELSCWSD